MKKIIFVTTASLIMLSGCSQVQDWSENLFGQKQQETKEEKPKKQTPGDQPEQDEQPEQEQPPTSEEEAVPPELQLESHYFNDVKVVGGKQVIQNPSNLLALVNKEYALDEYKPNDLVRPDVPFVFGNQELEKAYLRQEAALQLEKMFADAQSQGILLTAISGYRSYEYQKMLLEREIAQFGEEKAVMAVAPPGQSEHQSGLAIDISSQSNNFQVNIEFADTKEGKWLAENAYKYGFILRYPKDKVSITQYQYEPWHYRYVGKDAAKVIHENDWSLEEYFNNVKKI
ncbi:D-alanyl-D-alanine carboxypeptidase family protein [Rossellomorea aquimaris]|uniref:D-Ala-D-Ala carboxypeptidase n=1 Tax=Rossellomorea aquimaris TaxID=189382 RepID=A0A366EGG9_9BACI|nr:D-alanyl-D-alanine carboxypeptidase family protein [Rossellomorea aquimaris]RBP01106.1 D-Ala-D-Ala carboxypeptidase [Rossellomorea aquimaris]